MGFNSGFKGLKAQRHENYSDKPGCMHNVWAPPTVWCLVGN